MAQECPPGKVATTIINPAGKVIEICVPEAAIPNIGGGGDTVIPAVCPCFSQEIVQAAFDADASMTCESEIGTAIESGDCTRAACFNGVFFDAFEGPDVNKAACIYSELSPTINNQCFSDNISRTDLTEAEADACVAILQTFE